MTTIWKFQIPMLAEFEIPMPKGAEFLYIATQSEVGCLWARVNPENETEYRKFILRGTGHEIVDIECKHVGSFLLDGGAFFFHVFERTL